MSINDTSKSEGSNRNKFTAPNVVAPANQSQRQLQSNSIRSLVFSKPARYAGFWARLGASFIDWGLLSIYCAAIKFMLPWNSMPLLSSIVYSIVALGTILTYFAGLESSEWQATLGKHLLGLKVTDTEGGRISFWRAVMRYFGKYLSALPLEFGFIMIAFTERKQGLHDFLADTVVVYRK